jgi:hypothetical protein
LKEIEAQRVDGKFVATNGEVPAGNEEVCELLRICLLWSDIVLERFVGLISAGRSGLTGS